LTSQYEPVLVAAHLAANEVHSPTETESELAAEVSESGEDEENKHDEEETQDGDGQFDKKRESMTAMRLRMTS
jgi:hypothetical protein